MMVPPQTSGMGDVDERGGGGRENSLQPVSILCSCSALLCPERAGEEMHVS